MKVPNFRFFHVAVVLDPPSCNVVRSLMSHCGYEGSNWASISIIQRLPSTLVPLYEKSLMDTASKQHNINIRFGSPFRSRFSTNYKAVGINLNHGDLTKLQVGISANLRREVREEYKKLSIEQGGDIDKRVLGEDFCPLNFRATLLMGGFRPKIVLRSKLSDADADHWLGVLNKNISIPWQDMNLTGIGFFLKESLWKFERESDLRGEQVLPPLVKYFSFLEHTPKPIMKTRHNDANYDTEIHHK
jgi:hypothetical protein